MSNFPSVGTPASEWTEKTLAALNQPTAQTGGYVEPFSSDVTPSSSALPSSAATNAPVGDFATGVNPAHASGSIPSKANFASGIGGEHASGDIPSKALYADQSTFDGAAAYAQGHVTGGGLGSSPNVQAIAAQARSAHSEGLTRAELAASRAVDSSANDLSTLSGREQAAAQLAQLRLAGGQTELTAVPVAVVVPVTVVPVGVIGSGAQHEGILGGGIPVGSGGPAETPGLEVPGGWGKNKVPAPESTLYADVTQALHGVGTAAFSVLPKGVVNSLSTEKGPNATTTTGNTGIGGFLNSVKSVVAEITQEVKTEFAAPHTGTSSNTSPATLRTVDVPGTQPVPRTTTGSGLLSQAQNILLEGVHRVEALAGNAHANVASSVNGAGQQISGTASSAGQAATNVGQQVAGAAVVAGQTIAGSAVAAGQTVAEKAIVATEQISKATGIPNPLDNTTSTTSTLPSTSTAIAPATSLPTDEFAGARAGEHSDGVGALPGSSNETGVAILPEERRVGADLTQLPSSEIRGNREGDHYDGVGALPGGTADTGVAILPDERVASSIPEPSPAVEQTSSRSIPEPSPAFEAPASNLDKSSSGLENTTSSVPVASSTSGSSSADFVSKTYNNAPTSGASYGLAPALGAFRDATPLAAPDLSKETHIPTEIGTAIAAKPIASVPVAELSSSVADSQPAAKRMDSFTSTTAVLHGVAGDRETSKVPLPQSSLRQVSQPVSPVTEEKALPQAPASGGFSSFETDHKVPGTEHGGVGSSKSPLNESSAVGSSEIPKQSSPIAQATTSSAVTPAVASSSTSSPVHTPVTPSSVAHSDAAVSGHRRTESGSSTGKKSGFLSKIKAKLHHEKN